MAEVNALGYNFAAATPEPRPSTARGAGRLHDGDATPPSRIEPAWFIRMAVGNLKELLRLLPVYPGPRPKARKTKKASSAESAIHFLGESNA